jgi:hypothetical protein
LQDLRGVLNFALGCEKSVKCGNGQAGAGRRDDQPPEHAEGAQAVDPAGLVDRDGNAVEVALAYAFEDVSVTAAPEEIRSWTIPSGSVTCGTA